MASVAPGHTSKWNVKSGKTESLIRYVARKKVYLAGLVAELRAKDVSLKVLILDLFY